MNNQEQNNKKELFEAVENLHLEITPRQIIDVLTANGIENAAEVVNNTFKAEGITAKENDVLTAEQLCLVDAFCWNDEWQTANDDAAEVWQIGQIIIDEWPQLVHTIDKFSKCKH